MKILAFAGSNSKHSINKKLANYAAHLFKESEVDLIDLNDFPLPLFSVDIEKAVGFPKEAEAFLKKIEEADFIVLSLAENNASYNVGFKNVFDWASRKAKKVFQDKPMLLMATSPGERGGTSVLEFATKTLPYYGATIKATFSLPKFDENFDEEKGIINEELKQQLLNQIKHARS
ncbi:MAG: NAD(P)H-dependent oxidoreductase [Burkholderiales bacterium]|nr:NAD(P)H-dependent oxidoreductase [Bacteroidia bacterium]